MIKVFYVDAFDKEWFSGPFRLRGFEQARFDVVAFDYRAMEAVHGGEGMSDALNNSLLVFKPDVIFINKGHFGLKPDMLGRIKQRLPHTMLVSWCGDQRGVVMPEVVNCAQVADYFAFSNDDPELKKEYRKNGVKNIVEHHCATDIQIYKPHDSWPEKMECDVVFFGNNYKDSPFPLAKFRVKILQEINKHFKLKVYGQSWQGMFENVSSAHRERYAIAASASKVQLCMNAFDNIYRYTSNRVWNSLACNRLVVQHRFNGCESLLGKQEENMIYFDDIEDCLTKISLALDDDKRRMEIADRGRDFVADKHTYYHRAKELKALYDQWMEKDEWVPDGVLAK